MTKEQLAIRGHYLRQLHTILKPFFYHIGRSERLPALSAQDGFYLARTSSKNVEGHSTWRKNVHVSRR